MFERKFGGIAQEYSHGYGPALSVSKTRPIVVLRSGVARGAPGGDILLIKIKFWKEFKISNCLLLLNKVLNGLQVTFLSFCVEKP